MVTRPIANQLPGVTLLLAAGLAAAPSAAEPLRLRQRAELCERFGPAPSAALSGERLVIGYRADTAPFSFKDPEGKPAGYVVGLCEEVALRVVGEGRWEYREVTAEARFEELSAGTIDLLCDSSTLTLERAACFEHSLLTFPSGPALGVADRFAQRPSGTAPVRLGVLVGSSTRSRLGEKSVAEALAAELRVEPDQLKINNFPTYRAMFDALDAAAASGQDGGLDAMFADREILLAEARRRSQPGFTVSDEYLGYEPYTIYMRRGRLDDLSFKVNAAMVEIYESPIIHRLLTNNFPYRLADTVGHLIILQRLPKGDIYKP